MAAVTKQALAAILMLLPAVALPQPVPPPDPGAAGFPWSVSLGTGAGGFVEFTDAFAGGDAVTYDESRREGRLQLDARIDRAHGRWFRFGFAWVYNRWTEAFFTGGARVGEIENSVHTVMADVTATWIRTAHFELYSALAAGMGRWRERGSGIGAAHDHVTSGFAFQLRYAGISVGGERVRAFADLGIGFEGLIVGGLTLRF